MNIKNAIKRDFEKSAKNYDKHAQIQRIANRDLFSLIKDQINNDSVVLDIGCGTGYFHELLRSSKIYCDLVQSDLSEQMCKIASSYASQGKFGETQTIVCDMQNLPFEQEHFSHVYSCFAYQWSDDLSQSFKQIYKILKKQGVAAISRPIDGTFSNLKTAMSLVDGTKRVNDFYKISEIEKICKQAGFSDIQITKNQKTEYFANIKDLLSSIKGVGASYKGVKKYAGREYFNKLEQIYSSKFKDQQGLVLDWTIAQIILHKN